MKRKMTALLLALLMMLLLVSPALAAGSGDDWLHIWKEADSLLSVDGSRQTTAAQYRDSVPAPTFGAEWGVMAWCAGGLDSSYGNGYVSAMEKVLADCGGVLDQRKNTEYSRTILALTATGRDASKIAGYDLTKPLADVDATVKQGVNGAAFALLALDSNAYPSTVRQKYVDYLLEAQKTDGGWAMSGKSSDADVTSMVLQALAPYQSQKTVAKAIDSALGCLSRLQKSDGGFASYGVANCESCAQVILALCQLNIELSDQRFVKDKNTVLDAMNRFRLANGSYCHQTEGDASGTATEQAFLALTSLQRLADGLPGVFTLTSAYPPFTDIAGHWAQADILYGVQKGLFSSGGSFRPNADMTRSELVQALWQAAGTPTAKAKAFSDVPIMDSYYMATLWARSSGMMNGVSDTSFGPDQTLTRAQLATTLWRMAGKPAMKETPKNSFPDWNDVGAWAQDAMKWAVKTGLLKGIDGKLAPNGTLTRAQAATMLHRYLES